MPSVVLVVSQMNTGFPLTLWVFSVHFNIFLPLMSSLSKRYFPSVLPEWIFMYFSLLQCLLHAPPMARCFIWSLLEESMYYDGPHCASVHPEVTSSLLGPYIHLSIQFKSTFYLYSSINCQTKFHTNTNNKHNYFCVYQSCCM
jgi:hypothetical protein